MCEKHRVSNRVCSEDVNNDFTGIEIMYVADDVDIDLLKNNHTVSDVKCIFCNMKHLIDLEVSLGHLWKVSTLNLRGVDYKDSFESFEDRISSYPVDIYWEGDDTCCNDWMTLPDRPTDFEVATMSSFFNNLKEFFESGTFILEGVEWRDLLLKTDGVSSREVEKYFTQYGKNKVCNGAGFAGYVGEAITLKVKNTDVFITEPNWSDYNTPEVRIENSIFDAHNIPRSVEYLHVEESVLNNIAHLTELPNLKIVSLNNVVENDGSFVLVDTLSALNDKGVNVTCNRK